MSEIKTLALNQKVENFSFDAYHNNEIRRYSFSDFEGKWLAVVFYPADFTFVCPTELEELAQFYGDFQKAGAEILSVSTDTAYVHKAWHDVSPAVGKIQFPMVADPAGKLSRYFGVYIEEKGLAYRGSFLLDPDGVLKAYEVHDLSVGRSAQELLRKLQAAQFVREHGDQVCPAGWKPGDKTLKPGLDLVGKI
ncbi:MAG: peroxiredoxin [Planctomycetota bacterium]|nr:MAG: peroxiredoxin [Planctomycetota bacterium]